MANELDRPAAPALPLAPEGYERPYMDQNSNVLRLFFNRLVNAFDTLIVPTMVADFCICHGGLFIAHKTN